MLVRSLLIAASVLSLAACNRGGETDGVESEASGGADAAAAGFSGTPDEFEGVWAADCEQPFVRFEDRSIHVYPDGQTYELSRAEVEGSNLIVAYQSGNGAIEETYMVGDGTLQLVSGSYDRTAKIWDVAQKKEITSIGPVKSSIWSVAFSPDGKLIAVGSHDRLSIWEFSPRERFPAPATDTAE